MFLEIALIVVGVLIAIVALYAAIVSIWLFIKYVKYNNTDNSIGLTAEETARRILDDNGLEHIKVKTTGSILFGNSYSHYFKKVRIRRFTRHHRSITALGMGAQKASLAILDKEGDKDMRKRIKLYPLITFGPFAFVPLLAIGILLELLVFHTDGILVLAFAGLAVLIYAYAIVLSVLTLKTEKKAQEKAYEILAKNGMATEEELNTLKELFKLYNIQYINDIIISSLELLRFVLQILIAIKGNSTSSD